MASDNGPLQSIAINRLLASPLPLRQRQRALAMIGAAKLPRQAHFPALPAAFSRHVLLGVMASLVYHCRADVDDINGAQPRAQQSTVAGQAVAERELFTSPTLAVAAARFAACVGRVQCSVFRCAGLAREFQPMIGGTEGDIQSMSMSARDDITPPTLRRLAAIAHRRRR